MTTESERICPSDYRARDVAEQARRFSPARKAFAASLKAPARHDGPHYEECLAFLGAYVSTPKEREVWAEYRRYIRVPVDQWKIIEAAATSEGLTAREWAHREALKHLRWFVLSTGLPESGEEWLGWRPVNEYAKEAGRGTRDFRRYLNRFRLQGRAKNRPGQKQGDINMTVSAFEECKRQPQQ